MEPGVIGVTPWLPMVMTPDHPNYHDLEDTPGVVFHQVSPDDTPAIHQLVDQARMAPTEGLILGEVRQHRDQRPPDPS